MTRAPVVLRLATACRARSSWFCLPLAGALVLALDVVGLGATHAHASATVPLSIEKQGSFVRDAATGQFTVQVQVGADPALARPLDPACPTTTKVRIAFYRGDRVHGEPDVEVPCSAWRRTPLAWVYDDPSGAAGGIRHLRIGPNGLRLRADARGQSALGGPVAFAQVHIEVGDTAFLIRFHQFRRNDADAVIARRPSRDAGLGEAAFWRTLLGEGQENDAEAIAALGRAVRLDPADGRSHFLLGMIRLQRYERLVPDPRTPDRRGIRELRAATRSLERATALLWDGVNGDSRVPGFTAAAIYKLGIALGDPAMVARGIAAMNAAAASNPLFNGFIPLGAGPTAPRDGPEYATILHLLDVVFPSVFGECVGQGEICGNGGLAPHNLEGTFLLFGDLDAKAGRTAKARANYATAVSAGVATGWSPRFIEHARELAEGVERRVALYADDDPSNDPPFTDLGGAGNCAYCHNR